MHACTCRHITPPHTHLVDATLVVVEVVQHLRGVHVPELDQLVVAAAHC